jgi:hypothetical protein
MGERLFLLAAAIGTLASGSDERLQELLCCEENCLTK